MNRLMLLVTQLNLPKDLTQTIQQCLWTLLTQPITVGKRTLLAERFIISKLHASEKTWNNRFEATYDAMLTLMHYDTLTNKAWQHTVSQDTTQTKSQGRILLSSWKKHDEPDTTDHPAAPKLAYLARLCSAHYYQVPLHRIWTCKTDTFLSRTPYVLFIDPLIFTDAL